MPNFDWHAFGFVVGSQYRKEVVSSMVSGPKTPSGISEHTGIHRNHVSSTLRTLEREGLVVCLTPELKKGRLYELSKKGHEIADKL